jgi:hypothetical protein
VAAAAHRGSARFSRLAHASRYPRSLGVSSSPEKLAAARATRSSLIAAVDTVRLLARDHGQRRSPCVATGATTNPRRSRPGVSRGDPLGASKAAIAVAHSILVAAFHILDRSQPYQDLGGDWFVRRRSPDHHARKLVLQLNALGFDVQLQEHAAA